MLNLDTHILIDALLGELSKKELKALAANKWCISSIVLWEIAKLRELNRIEIDLLSLDFSRALSQITILHLTSTICEKSTELDIKSDPADELIAASSIIHNIPLMTRDKKILKSKITPLWR